MKTFIIIPALFLSGCSLLPTRTIVVDHNVLVTIPCRITQPQKPVMPLTDSSKIEEDIFVKTKKALAEIELRKGYEKQLETVVESCQ